MNVRNVHITTNYVDLSCVSIARDRMEVLVLKGLMIIGDKPQYEGK